ncbi:VapE domain-containing protein [Amaricoccus sp.]|uniref:VapE domain-containing protein n=1 Tax=Amaricoccus sp. TaxID=1872485 RepID=UPI001B6CECB5|nr:VapE domain-containing protein [Amaricoccus sp.]MBP7003530.1 toprim domain-containing protein [Amaricoccus sp.]
MIDLNDVWTPPPRIDLGAVKAQLAATAPDWLPDLFAQARLSPDRRTLRCADLSGRPPRKEGSCVIHLDGPYAGWGFDFSTGERAGPIDLIYHGTGLTDAALFEEAARLARMDRPAPPRQARPKVDHTLEVRRILDGCLPLAGSPAETYLRSRGLSDPAASDLLYHPDLTDYDGARGWPGMVAVPRGADGAPVGGIHRTFLLDDGSGKAPADRKMLGSVGDGAVRLFPLGADGHLGIAEGIETALAAQSMFGVPVWAALAADGVRRWRWPAGVTEVTIFADAGGAGRQAAAGLADRLNDADIPNRTVTPLHGDDFNDDLKRGAAASDYALASGGSDEVLAIDASGPVSTADDSNVATLDAELQAAAEALTNPPDVTALGMLLGRVVLARLDPLPERQVLARIKARTGIAVAVLDKQIAELRRRLNTTGDLSHRVIRPAWSHKLRLDLAGQPERNEANVITALGCDEAFAGAIVFDEFRQEILVTRPLPWDASDETAPRPWTDGDDVRAAEWLQRRELNVTPMTVSRSVAAVAHEITVHPVRDHLGALAWDGVPRIETWTCRYLGAADTAFNRSAGALWLISAVARIFRPGVKADHMLVLEGPQGARKSTALKILAGEDWFTDELPDLGTKDAAMHMQGVWIIEIAELDAISKAEVSRIKAFLSRTTDRFRPPYGRYTIEVPRQCVFAGTVNPDTYLRDETGNRRFWPVRCGTIDIEALARDRDQLWAEAVARFRAGAIWWLDTPELIAAATSEQEKRYQADAWDDLIERWLSNEVRTTGGGYPGYEPPVKETVLRVAPLVDVSIGEILEQAIGIEPARWTKGDQMRVGAYLRAKGWVRYRHRQEGGRKAPREWRFKRDPE